MTDCALPLPCSSTIAAASPALAVSNTGTGNAMAAASSGGDGLRATGGQNGLSGQTANQGASGVYGQNDGGGPGVAGRSAGYLGGGTGVLGESGGTGVHGRALESGAFGGVTGTGVFGEGGTGVIGEGTMLGVSGRNTGKGNGVAGQTSDPAASGVYGVNNGGGPGVTGDSATGTGVWGRSTHQRGVWGISDDFIATVGDCTSGTGVWGASQTGPGVHAQSQSYRGIEASGNPAGHFDGNVEITGTLTTTDIKATATITAIDVILSGGDCAEDFDTADAAPIEAGTVVIVDQHGDLRESREAYDRRVVGVVAGAANKVPGIVLNRHPAGAPRVPVALIGQARCKVDATHHPITVGDLLATSATPGHAMAVTGTPAPGTVIGKALRPVTTGQALIPILVFLR